MEELLRTGSTTEPSAHARSLGLFVAPDSTPERKAFNTRMLHGFSQRQILRIWTVADFVHIANRRWYLHCSRRGARGSSNRLFCTDSGNQEPKRCDDSVALLPSVDFSSEY